MHRNNAPDKTGSACRQPHQRFTPLRSIGKRRLMQFATLTILSMTTPAQAADVPVVWDQCEKMPTPLGRYAAAAMNGSIYLLGGVRSNIRSGGNYQSSLRRFDPATREWKESARCPVGTGGAVLVRDTRGFAQVMPDEVKPLVPDSISLALNARNTATMHPRSVCECRSPLREHFAPIAVAAGRRYALDPLM